MRWPWSPPRVLNAAPKFWPKKAYFLDGPMAGKTTVVRGGLFITIPVNTVDGISYWRYQWETIYATGAVAFVRFIP